MITGDNALVLRDPSKPRTSTTDRLGTSAANTRMDPRNIMLYDLNGATPLAAPAATQFGDDRVSGGAGTDVMYGQDGNDQLSGGPGDDYIQLGLKLLAADRERHIRGRELRTSTTGKGSRLRPGFRCGGKCHRLGRRTGCEDRCPGPALPASWTVFGGFRGLYRGVVESVHRPVSNTRLRHQRLHQPVGTWHTAIYR